MFHWCQKVNVYNIENHYHFYSNREQEVKEPVNLSYKKLRVGSISFMSTNTKRSSKSCIKKGLNISKKLSMSFNPQQNSPIIQNKNVNSQNIHAINILEHVRSASKSIGDTFKQKIPEHQNNNSKQMLTASHQSFRPDQQNKKTQKIDIKRKPSVFSNQKQNSDLMKKLYLTTPHSSLSSNINSIKYLQTSPVQKYQDIQEMTTSRNVCSKDVSAISSSARHSQISVSSNHQKNSKYNISIFDSLSYSDKRQNLNDDQRSGLYNKYLEVSRGQARQASIILSNILTRSNDKNYSSSHQRTQSIHSQKNKKRFNLQDKQTILSHQNDVTSLQSVKIEQSELCDMDPRNNFQIIPNKTFKNNIYCVDLAIENCAKCIVSLKQIEFRQMSFISQELQIYEFVQQVLSNRDSYHNILELYQVQTTNNSYLLIKQPYTHSFNEYIKNLQSQQVKQFIQRLQSMIRPLLIQFAHHMMYPSRLLSHTDFVICESVVKIHDLSAFKQMKNPPYTIEQIIQSLYINNSITTKADTIYNESVNQITFLGNNNSKYHIRVSQDN